MPLRNPQTSAAGGSTSASDLTSGTLSDSRLSANVTLQGNSFNAALKLVQMTAAGKYPALDGSLITNLAGAVTDHAAVHSASNGATAYYTTLAAAKLAAAANDLIEVFAGTYNEKNLLKNNVNWYFHDGAFVTYTGSANGAIFDDGANGAAGTVTCIIAGFGSFTNSGTGTGNFVINMDNASDITFNAKLAKSTVTDTAEVNAGTLTIPWVDLFTSSAFGSNALYVGGSATCSGAMRSISSTSGSAGKGIWSSGTTTIFANEIIGVGKGIYCDGGTLELDVYNVSSTLSAAIHVAGGSAAIRALAISTSGSGANPIKASGGTAYITADTIASTGNSGCVWGAGGTCYVNADTITCSSDYEPCVFTDSGSVSVESFLIKTTSGSQYGIGGTSGTLRVVSSRVENSGTNGVAALAGGQTLILEGAVTLVSAPGATDGLKATSPQNVKVYGFVCSNKAKNANVTLQVGTSVFSDPNVA